MGNEQRREPRSKTYAKVLLGSEKVPGYLRDLSNAGCHISLIKPITAEKEQNLQAVVIPGDEIGIPNFEISLKVLWTRKNPVYFSMGGRVSPLPGTENAHHLHSLFDYYAAP